MTAPAFRSVCQLTGDVAEPPSAFFTAIATADTHIGETAKLRAELASARATIADLEKTIDGLGAENAELRRDAAWSTC